MFAISPEALSLGLAGIAVFGTLAGGFIGMWSAQWAERKRQSFQREQDARRERAQSMQTARILDSVLMEAEWVLQWFVVEKNRLWPENLAVPDRAVWPELRGGIAAILEPGAWITVNVGFIALGHLSDMDASYRKLGYDDTTDLSPAIQRIFEPVLRDIRAAREALHPVAYPDHIRLPEDHPLLALRQEQRALRSPPPDAEP
jgi:hypothetical protein